MRIHPVARLCALLHAIQHKPFIGNYVFLIPYYTDLITVYGFILKITVNLKSGHKFWRISHLQF